MGNGCMAYKGIRLELDFVVESGMGGASIFQNLEVFMEGI